MSSNSHSVDNIHLDNPNKGEIAASDKNADGYTTGLIAAMNFSNLTLDRGSNLHQVPGLPQEMIFGEQHIITIILYCVFFVIAASGNLTVFITLFRNREQKIRVNMFIMHLAIADLIVTFIMMPMEIGWNSTVDWRAGDFGCRVLMFFRVFGLYLSSCVLVVISLDRYFAILHPLSLNDADKRGQIMLSFAWVFSVIVSIPQVSYTYNRKVLNANMTFLSLVYDSQT